MAILKCKMCGGDLNITEGVTVVECDYCGTKQTVPSADNEKKLSLFARANKLRASCDFDKAAGVYEALVSEFSEEAEAYWGLVLCKYGIEYVDDPATGKKIPTCHRSSFESVLDDPNFELVMENADALSLSVYREEAKQIEELRKGIIAVSSKEEPYDIFICYKETAENGDRTIDSVIAQDVYDELTAKGYRVFFSRITLEDKLGQEYEPYIFAALNSAKIMLAFGTCYEHYNAVWVKNEWSRFLQLIAKGEKKHIIPCYKGIDAYDMPKEFAKLQAQDMGKVGATQDLLRGIEKILPKNAEPEKVFVQSAAPQSATTETLLKRAFMYLEDGEWQNATEYCEKVLDIDPENGRAYLCKLLSELRLKNVSQLLRCETPLENFPNFQKAIRYGDENTVTTLKEAAASVVSNHKQRVYDEAFRKMEMAQNYTQFQAAAKDFQSISGFKDAANLAEECRKKAAAASQEEAYSHACELLAQNQTETINEALNIFTSIIGYRDAELKVHHCEQAILRKEKEIEDYWKKRYGEAFLQIREKKFAEAAKTLDNLEEYSREDVRIHIGRLLINYKVRDEKELAKQSPQGEGGIEANEYYKKILLYGDAQTASRFRGIASQMKRSKGAATAIGWLLGLLYLATSIVPAFMLQESSAGFFMKALIMSIPVVVYTVLEGIISRTSGNKYTHFDFVMSFFFVSILTDGVLLAILGVKSWFWALILNKIAQGIVGFLCACFTLDFENYDDKYNK